MLRTTAASMAAAHAFAPSVVFDPKVHSYLQHAFGPAKLAAISEALCRPSLRTCLRVNTLASSPQAVVQQLQQLFPATQPFVHPHVPGAVIVPGRGPLQPDYEACDGAEVFINRLAGEAVLKGAHVYSPGLLAATRGLAAGDLVSVAAVLEGPGGGWSGVNRGMTVTPELKAQLAARQQQEQQQPLVRVGLGRVTAGRAGLFRQQQGVAVEMTQRVFDIPPCNGILRGQVMLQALPCIVAAHALAPEPGSRVLDMCAAPGGKTSVLAQLMHDTGTLVALDRTRAKQLQVASLAGDMGLSCITPLTLDATQLWQRDGRQPTQQQQGQPQPVRRKRQRCELEPAGEQQAGPDASSAATSSSSSSSSSNSVDLSGESFDAVLLDAPCSALGLRPRLLVDWRLPGLTKLAAYQRALLHSAVHMLRPGGALVYCTCTINPAENEGNVRYVLDRFPDMSLVSQPLVLGGPGLIGSEWLTAAEAQLVQRFDPAEQSEDTIGFFVAKFVKKGARR